jgi:hypothetical protein
MNALPADQEAQIRRLLRGSVTRTGHGAPPLLDQHAEEIRSWLTE